MWIFKPKIMQVQCTVRIAECNRSCSTFPDAKWGWNGINIRCKRYVQPCENCETIRAKYSLVTKKKHCLIRTRHFSIYHYKNETNPISHLSILISVTPFYHSCALIRLYAKSDLFSQFSPNKIFRVPNKIKRESTRKLVERHRLLTTMGDYT